MKYLIIKSLRFKPAARRTKAAQSELRRGSIWHGKTKNKILQSLSFSMFFVNFKKIMYQQHPATVRNPFFLNFKCQPGTGRKLAQMMRARTPVRHCQYGNLKMTATDVNDVKIMKFDINWCRRWSCSNSGVKCDDMCCLWYHFSVLQPLQFVVLLATFSAVASESGAQHRYVFFCFEICALLAIGPPLNSIYIPSSTVHVFGTSWFCGPCRGKLYIPKKLQNQLETQPKLRCNGPERLRLNQVENSNLGGAGAWNRYKQIQTDSNFKHKKIGFVAFSAWNDCYCLFPGPDLGDAKNLVFDEAGAMPTPNFECKLVEFIPLKINALHFWTGMSRLATGTQLNPTSSRISAIEVSWKKNTCLKNINFLKEGCFAQNVAFAKNNAFARIHTPLKKW